MIGLGSVEPSGPTIVPVPGRAAAAGSSVTNQ
jgi:hypothetical protein